MLQIYAVIGYDRDAGAHPIARHREPTVQQGQRNPGGHLDEEIRFACQTNPPGRGQGTGTYAVRKCVRKCARLISCNRAREHVPNYFAQYNIHIVDTGRKSFTIERPKALPPQPPPGIDHPKCVRVLTQSSTLAESAQSTNNTTNANESNKREFSRS